MSIGMKAFNKNVSENQPNMPLRAGGSVRVQGQLLNRSYPIGRWRLGARIGSAVKLVILPLFVIVATTTPLVQLIISILPAIASYPSNVVLVATLSVTLPIIALMLVLHSIAQYRLSKALQRAKAAEAAKAELETQVVECKRIEMALREIEERYALAVSAANDGVWDWNLSTNGMYLSSRWKSLLGCEEGEIGNKPEEWWNRIHPEDISQVKTEMDKHLQGLTAHFESEYRILHKDGTYHWMRSRGLAVRDENQKVYRMAGSMTDITERKIAEAQLLYEAFHDPLTGLSNRALFMNRLEHAVEHARRRTNYLFAVLFLDLDRFKNINDSLGHQCGDQVLIDFVQRVKTCLRSGDLVARLGGDEFAVLLEDINDIGNATAIAERIHHKMQFPFNLKHQEIFTSVSIGIALNKSDCNNSEELLQNADLAMYRAKSLGKGCYQIFDSSMQTKLITPYQREKVPKALEAGLVTT